MDNVLLLFPPQWSPTQPYLALPSLVAFLRERGKIVYQRDLNIEFYDHILSKNFLESKKEYLFSRFSILNNKRDLSSSERKEYSCLFDAIASYDFIIKKIEDAKANMRNEKMLDFLSLKENLWTIERALSIFSALYFPSKISLTSYEMDYSPYSSSEIISAVHDKNTNPLLEIIPALLQKQLDEISPILVGISITGSSQILPGLTIGAWIKENYPQIHVVLGGNIPTRWMDCIEGLASIFGSSCDSIIGYEGEIPLDSLIDTLKKQHDLSEVPNLIFRDGTGRINQSFLAPPVPASQLPTPIFDGLPLDKYFSPEPVFPILAGRGCYWNKCTFCDHSHIYGARYSIKSAQNIVNDMVVLGRKYGARAFTFSDEGLSPHVLDTLSQEIIKQDIRVTWTAAARLENALLAPGLVNKLEKAGLKSLYLGFESGSPSVLEKMQKGIDINAAQKICENLTSAGVWVHLFFMVGFPTETTEDIDSTVNFIKDNYSMIDSFGVSQFGLLKFAKLLKKKKDYFSNTWIEENHDLAIYLDYCLKPDADIRSSVEDALTHLEDVMTEFYPQKKIWQYLDRSHLLLYLSKYNRRELLSAALPTHNQPKNLRHRKIPKELWKDLAFLEHSWAGVLHHSLSDSTSSNNSIIGFLNIKTGGLIECPQKFIPFLGEIMDGTFTEISMAEFTNKMGMSREDCDNLVSNLIDTLVDEEILTVTN